MTKSEEIIDSILTKRGFLSADERKEFLSDKPKQTYDPYLLPDIEEGTDFLFSSLEEGKRICIYGDYDVDGIMSTVLMYTFIKKLIENKFSDSTIDWYIPSRFHEGYGLNTNALSTIKERGTDIVITVDCGSVSKSEIEYAESLGLDIIVTDHHQCFVPLLPGCPVINPSREDSEYPFPSLSGCGVAFKTMQAFRQKFYPDDNSLRNALNDNLDIVAIATVADVVPLIDENRTLVKYGLGSIKARKRLALAKLCDKIQIDSSNISAMDIGFRIGPHINAAGRLNDASPVIELFLTQDESRMDEIIDELISLNSERQKIQLEAEKECIKKVDSEYPNDDFLLVRPDDIHEGVSGIVASKVKSRYNRPTAILALLEDNQIKGSARSTQGIDLIALLRRHEALFTKLGGHAMAAGFTFPAENENELREALNKDIADMLSNNKSLFAEDYNYDYELQSGDLSLELADKMSLFEPTGTKNPTPLLLINNPVISKIKFIGSDSRHLSFNADGVRCIYFNPDEQSVRIIQESNKLQLFAELSINTWKGYRNIQLGIKKVRENHV